MAELKNRQWLLAARPHGIIKESDFRWNETVVPPLKDGQVVVRNLAFSFDPTQRGWMSMDTYMPAIPLGQTMKAGTIGQVVDSKRPGFAKGDLARALRMGGLHRQRRRRIDGLAETAGWHRPGARAIAARNDGTDGILRHARGRCSEVG